MQYRYHLTLMYKPPRTKNSKFCYLTLCFATTYLFNFFNRKCSLMNEFIAHTINILKFIFHESLLEGTTDTCLVPYRHTAVSESSCFLTMHY